IRTVLEFQNRNYPAGAIALGTYRRSAPLRGRNFRNRAASAIRSWGDIKIAMSTPLEGVRVLDLSWVMVGPVSGRYLADLGADVIKVESRGRIDPLRTLGPFKDGKSGPERSISYHNLNAGKRCVAINLKEPRGRDLILRLVDWADVVLES